MTVALAHSFSSSLYDMHGRTSSLLQSEQVQRIMVPPDSGDDDPASAAVRDRVTLSPGGLEMSRAGRHKADGPEKRTGSLSGEKDLPQELSPEEEKALAELQARDREVRAHEQAHLASAGRYAAGGASYTWQTGPDGKQYAVGGEVPIDLSEEQDPAQTIQKMRTVRRAALAPAEPSAADRNIAATASQKEARARQELQAEKSGTTSPLQDDEDKEQETESVHESPVDGPLPPRGQVGISIMA